MEAKRKIPTSAEVLKHQHIDHQPGGIASKGSNSTIVPVESAAVAVIDGRSVVEKYLDEIAPASLVGRMVKFSKEGKFITSDDGVPIEEDAEFTAFCDQTLVGYIKFNGEGCPPDRHQGLLYEGFELPLRRTLGDLVPAGWPLGLDNKPSDPWQHQMCLVLQNTQTLEMYTFVTSSKTGRRAVGDLLRHYNRVLKTNPADYPVLRLRTGGFQHSDARIGWVSTPTFVVIGRRSRDSVTKPDTSTATDMNDSIPEL